MPDDQLNDMQQQINDHQTTIGDLQNKLDALHSAFYTNNFSGNQDFTKYSRFQTRLKIPHYDVLPNTCHVGEIIEYGGTLKVCSALNTWVSAGSQT